MATRALTSFMGQVNPQDIMKFIDQQNTSELGKLLQSESLSEQGYVTGIVVQKIGDLANALIEANKISTKARAEVQCIAMRLVEKAFQQQNEIQQQVIELGKEQQKLIAKINSKQAEVAKIMERATETFMTKVLEVQAKYSDPVMQDKIINMFNKAHDTVQSNLRRVTEAQESVAKTSNIDPAFFNECTKQYGVIIQQVQEMALQLAQKDESQLKLLTSEIGQTMRCVVGAITQALPGTTSAALPSTAAPTALPASAAPAALPAPAVP